jgi:hypothetical protein
MKAAHISETLVNFYEAPYSRRLSFYFKGFLYTVYFTLYPEIKYFESNTAREILV